MTPPPPKSTLFPYTTLFRSVFIASKVSPVITNVDQLIEGNRRKDFTMEDYSTLDRKSTRLNSSHPSISYAVFCLKKKINYFTFVSLRLIHFILHIVVHQFLF